MNWANLTKVINDTCSEGGYSRATISRALTGMYHNYDRNEIYKAQSEIKYQIAVNGYVLPGEWPGEWPMGPRLVEYSELEPVIKARSAYLLKALGITTS